MLRFTRDQFAAMHRDVFARLLEVRISEQEEQPVALGEPVREQLWTLAQALSAHGIHSIRGCLVVCHIAWEMGPEVFDRVPAFGAVLRDPSANEGDKVEALWLLRTQLLASLKGE